MAAHLVGIDLGTTNTVVYRMDAANPEAAPEIFMIPQVVERGEAAERKALPSFVYLPDPKETPKGALDLPWRSAADFCVGEYARKRSPEAPGKVVSSMKSWLCSKNVDRMAKILPWGRNNPERQLSPVEASAAVLAHVRDAWNERFAKDDESLKLENQEIVLTVPASFDAVARELTMKAAEAAGLKPTLLEEPLAAFYCWLLESGEAWREKLKPGQTALVVDIGGGTSDFTLVRATENKGELSLERAAVGRHILLGGDNMDLTLAYVMAAKLKAESGASLDQLQLAGLTHACRQAKETLLSSSDAPAQKLTVLGRGSGVVGGSLSVTLSKEELDTALLDGFLPECGADAKPVEQVKAGLRSFGLAYEADPAITRHLADFIASNCASADAMPTAILFNGGVVKGARLKERLLSTIGKWLPGGSASLQALAGTDPDLAVAKGACFYAAVRKGKGIRVKAGSPRSYYLGVESSMPAVPGFKPPTTALCVVPFGMEEGSGADIACDGLGLLVGENSEFTFFASTARKDDKPGATLDDAFSKPELEALAPLSTRLQESADFPPGSLVPVSLRGELTETGTLQVSCVGPKGEKWKLEFELRAAGQPTS